MPSRAATPAWTGGSGDRQIGIFDRLYHPEPAANHGWNGDVLRGSGTIGARSGAFTAWAKFPPYAASRPAQPRPRICSRRPMGVLSACGIIRAVLARAQPDPRPSRRIRGLTPRCRRRSRVRRRISGYVAQDCEPGRFSTCAVALLACGNLLYPGAIHPHWLASYPSSTPASPLREIPCG